MKMVSVVTSQQRCFNPCFIPEIQLTKIIYFQN